jgi:hypothetical protein
LPHDPVSREQVSWPTVPPLFGYVALAVPLVIAAVSAGFAFWPQSKVPRDRPLGEALAYACFRQWGRRFIDAAGTHGSGVNEELGKWHQLARDGRVAVWGIRTQHSTYERLGPEYWSDHEVEWFSLLKGKDSSEPTTQAYSDQLRYDGLMVSRAQVEKEWPKRKRYSLLPWSWRQPVNRQQG